MFVILNKFCVIICKHYLDRYSKVATDVNKALHVRDKWCINPFIVKSGTTITTVSLSNDKFTIQRCLLQSFFCSEGETFISQLTHTQNRDRNHCSSFIFLLAGVCCTSRAVSVCVVFLVKRSWEWPGALSPLTADQLTQHKARYCFLDDDGDDGGECLNFQSRGGGGHSSGMRLNLMQRKCLSSLWIITSPPEFFLRLKDLFMVRKWQEVELTGLEWDS